MAADVVAIDDRRVLEVWPGANGAVKTWDGLTAELASAGGRTTLRLSSVRPRPLEVRVLGRTVRNLTAIGATVRRDVARRTTTIRLPAFSGAQTLSWTEGGRAATRHRVPP